MNILLVGSPGPHLAAAEAAASHHGHTRTLFEPFTTADYVSQAEGHDLVIAVKAHDVLPLGPAPLWVVHDSLLPRWRGCAPVAHGLLAGDTAFGATLLRANERPDEGEILQQRRLHPDPGPGETAREIQVRMVPLYYDLVFSALRAPTYGKRLPRPKGAPIGPAALRAADYDVRLP